MNKILSYISFLVLIFLFQNCSGQFQSNTTVGDEYKFDVSFVSSLVEGSNQNLSPLHSFGEIELGKELAKDIIIRNTGQDIAKFKILIAGKGFKLLSNNCPSSLKRNSSCSVNVLFSPTTTVEYIGQLTLQSNQYQSAQGISGTGINSGSPTVQSPVAPAPKLSLSLDRAEIVDGDSVELSWVSSNTTKCLSTHVITNGLAVGSVILTPSKNATYTVECTGDGGSISLSASVVVTPKPVAPAVAPAVVDLVIKSVKIQSITTTSAKIYWELSDLSQGYIEYGPTNNYDNQTPHELSFKYAAHQQSLEDLLPGTTYHFRVVSKDKNGNITKSENRIFRTLTSIASSPESETEPNREIASTMSEQHNEIKPSASTVELSLASLIIEDVDAKAIDSTSVVISWKTNAHTTGQVAYGMSTEYGHFSKLEDSFKYSSHQQVITGLTSNTTYNFKIIAMDANGNKKTSDNYKIKTLEAPSNHNVNQTVFSARDKDWINQGYSLSWSNTPTSKDIGKNLKSYLQDEWANGYPLAAYTSNGNIPPTIERAPDGTPAILGTVSYNSSAGSKKVPSNYDAFLVRGNQFGPQGVEKTVIFSQEWFTPVGNSALKPNGDNGSYLGFGHHWASAPGVTRAPGGGTFYHDAWSVRVPTSKSNNYWIYGYFTEGQPKLSQHSSVKPVAGRWELIELKVKQNTPASAHNAEIELYINKKLVTKKTNFRTRSRDDVRIKGFGMFIQHINYPGNIEQYYIRNMKMYTK